MSTIDWSKIRDVAEVLVIVWGFISGGIVLWLRGQFVTRKTYDAEVRRLDSAIAACASASNEKIGAIGTTVSQLDERTRNMNDSIGTVRDLVTRIDDFLRTVGRNAA